MLTELEIDKIDHLLNDESVEKKDGTYRRCALYILPLFEKIENKWFNYLRENCHTKLMTLKDFKSISYKEFKDLGFTNENVVDKAGLKMTIVHFKPFKWDIHNFENPFDAMCEFRFAKETFIAFDKAFKSVFGGGKVDLLKDEIDEYYQSVLERNEGIGDNLREMFGLKKQNA